jgi:hypothetical protein
MTAGTLTVAPPASAGPTVCDVPACIPGVQPDAVIGAPCTNTTYYVFGVTSFGRMVYCGSPRRLAPRWFRTLEVRGIKDLNTDCSGYDYEMAQAPDGLFLTCTPGAGDSLWLRGDA